MHCFDSYVHALKTLAGLLAHFTKGNGIPLAPQT